MAKRNLGFDRLSLLYLQGSKKMTMPHAHLPEQEA